MQKLFTPVDHGNHSLEPIMPVDAGDGRQTGDGRADCVHEAYTNHNIDSEMEVHS